MNESATQNDKFPVRRLVWVLLTICLIAIYLPSINAPFVYDDKIEVIGNPTIRFLEEWKAILLYNPSRLLLQISYALNFHFGTFDPRSYHISNLAIQILTAACSLFFLEQLFLLFQRKQALVWAALLSTIWTLHPMATESVSYITGRSESLCALFSILALGFYAKGLRSKSTPLQGLAWFLTILALLVKEVAVVLPLAFLWMEYCLPDHRLSKRMLLPVLLFFGLGFGIRFFIVANENPDGSLILLLQSLLPNEVDRPLLTQLNTQMEVWLRYAGLWTFPYQQTIFHHIPDLNPFSVKGVGIFVAWITVLGLGFKNAKQRPLALFALGVAILFLLPSSSFAALKENMAEHRSHQFGLFFLIFLGSFLSHKSISWKIVPAFALVLSFLTYQRNQVWTSEVRLWQEATIHSPDSAPAWYGLGDAHRFAKQFEPALAAYSTCTRLDKEYLDCWNNFGITYAEMGNSNKAIDTWEQVLRIKPTYCKAHTNLGFLAYQQERWEDAITEFRSTIVNCPNNIISHYGLGLIYYRPRFDKEKATYHLDRVLQINPNFDYASDARKKLLELTW